MKKASVLSSLTSARLAHEEWLESGRKLANGDYLKGIQQPLKHDRSAFGQWLHLQKEFIENISGFDQVEILHKEFHEIYERLYINSPRVYKSKGIFSSKKLQATQKDYLVKDYYRLHNTSKKLVKKLLHVEKVVATMSDRLFERNKKQCRLVK